MAEHRADMKDGWQRYDWNRIALDYVCNPAMSLRKIAKKYGCNIKTVARHSVRGGWYQKRKDAMYNIVREMIVNRRMKDAEAIMLELLNEDCAAFGLDPIADIGASVRDDLRKEIEELVDSGELWFI